MSAISETKVQGQLDHIFLTLKLTHSYPAQVGRPMGRCKDLSDKGQIVMAERLDQSISKTLQKCSKEGQV